jgi:hypothetical protein
MLGPPHKGAYLEFCWLRPTSACYRTAAASILSPMLFADVLMRRPNVAASTSQCVCAISLQSSFPNSYIFTGVTFPRFCFFGLAWDSHRFVIFQCVAVSFISSRRDNAKIAMESTYTQCGSDAPGGYIRQKGLLRFKNGTARRFCGLKPTFRRSQPARSYRSALSFSSSQKNRIAAVCRVVLRRSSTITHGPGW